MRCFLAHHPLVRSRATHPTTTRPSKIRCRVPGLLTHHSPVHAWAAWRVYKIDKKQRGKGDISFLKRVFQKVVRGKATHPTPTPYFRAFALQKPCRNHRSTKLLPGRQDAGPSAVNAP